MRLHPEFCSKVCFSEDMIISDMEEDICKVCGLF